MKGKDNLGTSKHDKRKINWNLRKKKEKSELRPTGNTQIQNKRSRPLTGNSAQNPVRHEGGSRTMYPAGIQSNPQWVPSTPRTLLSGGTNMMNKADLICGLDFDAVLKCARVNSTEYHKKEVLAIVGLLMMSIYLDSHQRHYCLVYSCHHHAIWHKRCQSGIEITVVLKCDARVRRFIYPLAGNESVGKYPWNFLPFHQELPNTWNSWLRHHKCCRNQYHRHQLAWK